MVVVFCQNASKRFADLQIFMQDLAELSSLFMRAAESLLSYCSIRVFHALFVLIVLFLSRDDFGYFSGE